MMLDDFRRDGGGGAMGEGFGSSPMNIITYHMNIITPSALSSIFLSYFLIELKSLFWFEDERMTNIFLPK